MQRAASGRRQAGRGDEQAYYEKLCRKFSQISSNADGGVLTSSENKIV